MKKLISLILSLALLVSFSVPAMATNKSEDNIFDTAKYYPAVATNEWSEMEREKRVNATQISDEVLKSMSTDNLLQAVLEYPFMIDLYAFNSYAEGFEHVYSEFTALKELANRKDLGAQLVDIYQLTPVAKSEKLIDYESIRNLSILEILLAQPEITDSLRESEIISLSKIAEEKYIEKSNTMSINGGNLRTFYDALDENPVAKIASIAYVKTPKGTSVLVENNSSITDWTSAEKTAFNSTYATAYPSATRISDPTKKYNCHSYAWYSTSTTNTYWMNDPTAYMTDGSYTSTTSSTTGNKVYWYYPGYLPAIPETPEHSGILALNMKNSPYISSNSKWGQLGVYNHPVNDSPYGGNRNYWKS